MFLVVASDVPIIVGSQLIPRRKNRRTMIYSNKKGLLLFVYDTEVVERIGGQ